MAVSKALERWPFPVTNALGNLSETEKQFHFVTLSSTSTLSLPASGDSAVFVLEDTPKAGEFGTVILVGVTKVLTAEKIEAGQLVGTNSKGEAQVAVKGQYVAGVCLVTAEKGTMCTILVSPGTGWKLP